MKLNIAGVLKYRGKGGMRAYCCPPNLAAPVSPSPIVRADTVKALAVGIEERTAGRIAELIARRYMMMIMVVLSFGLVVLRK